MSPWISRAEHALRTGQPNLAILYMQRGISTTPQGRSWLRRHEFAEGLRMIWEHMCGEPFPGDDVNKALML